jgi:BON domain
MFLRLCSTSPTLSVRRTVPAAAAACSLMVFLFACAKTISDTVDDLTITARVKTALLNDTELDATKIDVDTAEGVVTLSGTVKSEPEAARAIDLTRRTPGVKDVKSTIQIGSAGSRQRRQFHSSRRILVRETPISVSSSGMSATRAGGPQTKHSVAGS